MATRMRLARWEPGMKQSGTCERIRRILMKAYPDFDFTRYPVQFLRPSQREFDRPAWSIAAVPPPDKGWVYNTVSFYSQDTMTEVLRYGLSEVTRSADSVMLMAGSNDGE